MSARDNWGQVAHNLRILADSIDAAIEPPAASAGVPESLPAASAAGASAPQAPAARHPQRPPQDESAFTECPAHHKAWIEGRYGKYCPAHSDDPDWSNDKGYCRVTPRSAAAWLRKHAPQVTA
jgi:hypothetical protein